MKLPKCCRSDTEEEDELKNKGKPPCKSQSSPDGKYCEVDGAGKKVCRNLSAYECQLEDQVETLQNALFTLSSHYAKIQFRLRQITNANSCERQRLLRELEYMVTKGIDNQSENEELPCLLSDAHLMGDARSKQRKIIKDLRSQLGDLSQSAALCFDTDEGGCYNFNKNRSYRIRYEYSMAAECEEEDEEYYEPKHGKGCMCCNCISRYAPNYPTCSCRQAVANKIQKEMEFNVNRETKMDRDKIALERGYLPQTWIPNDCNCTCEEQYEAESSKEVKMNPKKKEKKDKKRRSKSKGDKNNKVSQMALRSGSGCRCTCLANTRNEENEKRKKAKGKGKRGRSNSRPRKSASKAKTNRKSINDGNPYNRKSINSPYDQAAVYLNYYSDDQNNRHCKRYMRGGIKNNDMEMGGIVKCKCHDDYPYELRELAPAQTDPNYRPQGVCSKDCRRKSLTDGPPQHPLHGKSCQCCICRNRVEQDLAEASDSDQRTSLLFEEVRKHDKVPNPIGIEDSDVYSDEQIEKYEKLITAQITNPIGIEDSLAYNDQQEEKEELKKQKLEREKAAKTSDSERERNNWKSKKVEKDKSENKFKTEIDKSSSPKKKRTCEKDEQKLRNPLGIITSDSYNTISRSPSQEERDKGRCFRRNRNSKNCMKNNLIVKSSSSSYLGKKHESHTKKELKKHKSSESHSSEYGREQQKSAHSLKGNKSDYQQETQDGKEKDKEKEGKKLFTCKRQIGMSKRSKEGKSSDNDSDSKEEATKKKSCVKDICQKRKSLLHKSKERQQQKEQKQQQEQKQQEQQQDQRRESEQSLYAEEHHREYKTRHSLTLGHAKATKKNSE